MYDIPKDIKREDNYIIDLYYPPSVQLTWLVKLTRPLDYVGIGHNKQYHNFKGPGVINRYVYFLMSTEFIK